jgi:hypothetical protein
MDMRAVGQLRPCIPKALLDACSELVKRALTFEHPADSVVSYFFRENRYLGPRERATLAETTYTVLRKKLLFEGLAHSGSGARERRLAILGFAAVLREQAKKEGKVKNKEGQDSETFIKAALTPQELKWLAACDGIKPEELMEAHRHNLPEWLVEPLKRRSVMSSGLWPRAWRRPLRWICASTPSTTSAPICARNWKKPASRPSPHRSRPSVCVWTANPRWPRSMPSTVAPSRCRMKARNCWH